MAKTRDNYQVQANNLPELILGLNLLLQRMADRMDKIEGIRGEASIESDLDMNMNQITELEASTETTDAVQNAELPDQGTGSSDSPTFEDITINDDALIKGDLTVNTNVDLQGTTTVVNITSTGNYSTTGSYKYTDSAGSILHSFATIT